MPAASLCKQKKVFEEQLILAKELDIPVIVHDREAHGDTLEMLRKYKPKGILHCFSGSVEMMREVVKLGMSISLGGVVTFKNAKHSVNVASEIPLDRLMLETDAPYMAPVPFRGKRCDSSMIIYCHSDTASLLLHRHRSVIHGCCERSSNNYNEIASLYLVLIM